MKESNFQTEFGKKNKLEGVFELKFCKGKSLPFNVLAEHQKDALSDISSPRGLYYKLSDFPIFAGSKMRFNKKKPFDCFRLEQIDAYVVVMFWIPRKKKMVYYIAIESWLLMKALAQRKSATEGMCAESADYIVDYLKKTS